MAKEIEAMIILAMKNDEMVGAKFGMGHRIEPFFEKLRNS